MYLIIQKIYEENKEILEEGLKNVFNGADVSSLTGAIKDFTDILGKELLTEIIGQVDKVKFERRYYKDKETGENVCLADKVLGLEKGERIDKNVKATVVERANDQSYNKSGKGVVPKVDISATTVMKNVRKNMWKMEIEERKEEEKIKSRYVYIQVDEDHIKERNKKGCTISKIVTIYTRKRTLTKPDRLDKVKIPRRIC